MTVDFPLPDWPTRAMLDPAGTTKLNAAGDGSAR